VLRPVRDCRHERPARRAQARLSLTGRGRDSRQDTWSTADMNLAGRLAATTPPPHQPTRISIRSETVPFRSYLASTAPVWFLMLLPNNQMLGFLDRRTPMSCSFEKTRRAASQGRALSSPIQLRCWDGCAMVFGQGRINRPAARKATDQTRIVLAPSQSRSGRIKDFSGRACRPTPPFQSRNQRPSVSATSLSGSAVDCDDIALFTASNVPIRSSNFDMFGPRRRLALRMAHGGHPASDQYSNSLQLPPCLDTLCRPKRQS